MRAWLIGHTSVAARDSIGFIRYALSLEQQPWSEVIRGQHQHPGYPVVLMVVSWPIRALWGTNAVTTQLSAQVASGLASVLLVIPMYYLGRELFDRRTGFWGSLLFQCLPVSARILSDGLSEATFLLLTTTALLLAVLALRTHSIARFALCGLFSGLAYLTRPEGLGVIVAAGVVLAGMQVLPAWRCSWRRLLACGGSMALAAFLVGAPFMLITGKFTVKPTGNAVLGWQEAAPAHEEPSGDTPGQSRRQEKPISAGPLTASLLGIYAPSDLKDRRWWGVEAVTLEVIKAYQYYFGIPVLVGLWWFRKRLRAAPGAWILVAMSALQGLVLWHLAVVIGYVSDRHVQVLVLCGVYTAAAALLAVGPWLVALVRRLRGKEQTAEATPSVAGRWLSLVLLVSLVVLALSETLRPLHINRAGHRAAGEWLAAHTVPADPLEDPFCWAHFYADRLFWEGKELPPPPAGHKVTGYVVLEGPDHDHPRLPTLARAEELADKGGRKLVYYWPDDKGEAQARVRVYAVPAELMKP
jgi:4-amino-4-deoxy-L-arabinose transferase-like glycosyltransferase